MQSDAARNIEAATGDVIGLLRQEKSDGFADMLRRRRGAERRTGRLDVIADFPTRRNVTRRHRIDANAERADFLRQRLAKHDGRRLAAGIDGGLGAALQAARAALPGWMARAVSEANAHG